MSGLATIEEALASLRAGRPVLVLDDADRENEGDVVLAAETITARWMGWTIRHSSGYVCAPMSTEWADRLDLPLMVQDEANEDLLRTAYTVTVDAASGVGTGISAADRARTVELLGDAATVASDLRRPGHIVPLRARPGGVLVRRGHTEAAVDLCDLAGLAPVAAIAELVDDEGEMLRTPHVLDLGDRWDLPVITIAQLVEHLTGRELVRRGATTLLPTVHGTFTAHGYRDLVTGADHIALVAAVEHPGDVPLVRVHSECVTGEALGSRRCDCGEQLDDALARIAAEGGVLVYLRGHEGRGVGLLDKLRAYAEQDLGADTVSAQERLGLPVDARDYGAAAAILHDLDTPRIRLISHNPDKEKALMDHGIDLTEVLPSGGGHPQEATAYLHTKVSRLGHRPHGAHLLAPTGADR